MERGIQIKQLLVSSRLEVIRCEKRFRKHFSVTSTLQKWCDLAKPTNCGRKLFGRNAKKGGGEGEKKLNFESSNNPFNDVCRVSTQVCKQRTQITPACLRALKLAHLEPGQVKSREKIKGANSKSRDAPHPHLALLVHYIFFSNVSVLCRPGLSWTRQVAMTATYSIK